jgi:uncharacterized protein DUF4159
MRRLTARILVSVSVLLTVVCSVTQPAVRRVPPSEAEPLKIARVQYYGGDYYTDPTSLPNLARFATEKTGVEWSALDGSVSLLDPNLNTYPVLYLTGHGEIRLKEDETEALRGYLEKGGFLIANDNGPERSGNSVDRAFRHELAKAFPDSPLLELPKEHPAYHSFFDFPEGLPQIHRHDENQPPRGYGLYLEGRLAVFYAWNSDLGNGWEDPDVHGDPQEKRVAALEMGTNLLLTALLQ